jgi:hypothetical protein
VDMTEDSHYSDRCCVNVMLSLDSRATSKSYRETMKQLKVRWGIVLER